MQPRPVSHGQLVPYELPRDPASEYLRIMQLLKIAFNSDPLEGFNWGLKKIEKVPHGFLATATTSIDLPPGGTVECRADIVVAEQMEELIVTVRASYLTAPNPTAQVRATILNALNAMHTFD